MMQTDIQVPDSERAPSTAAVARVLVVDDDVERELLSIVQRRDGYDGCSMATAGRGRDAEAERVDVLIPTCGCRR